MANLYDVAYGLVGGLASPFWLAKPSARRKVLGALHQRMGHVNGRDLSKPALMVHAVSLGEVNATVALLEMLRKQRPDLHLIVSVTTETGLAQATKLYGDWPDLTVIRYPLDFTTAVRRMLDTLRPTAVALMELELWPNFIGQCEARGIPVVLINGRMTPGSFQRYRMARWLVGSMFARLRRVCVQDEANARRFGELGVRPEALSVTGTMKFDTAQVADHVEGQEQLAADLGLQPGKERIWVCGSTGPGEEEIILRIFQRMRNQFHDLRLVIVPRKPERFDEVAKLIVQHEFSLLRRSFASRGPLPNPPPEYRGRGDGAAAVILGDTMGELRKFYAIADVVFVGRSLVDPGEKQRGSDMIEPAALAKPIVVGKYTDNFAQAMERLTEKNAIEIAEDEMDLEQRIVKLLNEPSTASAMAASARQVVVAQQGATARHVDMILQCLDEASAAQNGKGRA